MKKIAYLSLSVLVGALALGACDDDKDIYKISEPSETELQLESGDNIVITTSNLNKVVLQMSYSRDLHELYLTNDSAATTLADGVYVLQVSTDNTFTKSQNIKTFELLNGIKGANDIAYTGSELNVLAQSLGLETGKAGTLYYRVGHAYNTASVNLAKYTEPIAVSVVPIYIDMHYCIVLPNTGSLANADGEAYRLFSPAEDYVYTGFIPTAGGWYNFWLQDGVGQVWGNLGQDNSFCMVDLQSNSAWNFWTGEPAGCIYVWLNLNSRYISFSAVQSLKATTATEAVDLVFDKTTCKWSGIVSTTADNQTIRLSGTTLINDNGTGAAEADANAGTINFRQQGDSLVVSSYADDIVIAKAGQYKLTLDLSHVKLTMSLESMDGVKTYPEKVYALVGEEKTLMTTIYTDGLANGNYSIQLTTTTDNQLVSFVDEEGQTLADDVTLDEAGVYDIALDVDANKITFEKVELISDVVYIYAKTDDEYSSPLATFYSTTSGGNATGIYSGVYGGSDWFNYIMADGNGRPYGSSGWDLKNFVADNTDNYWIDNNSNRNDFFFIFNAVEATVSYDSLEMITLTGDFNEWNATSTAFTNNGDGTWTLSDVELKAESWGPYLLINPVVEGSEEADWSRRYYIKNGFLAPEGDFIVSEDGTYDIVINTSENSIVVIKK